MRPWIRVLLVGSLAMNLLVVGLVAGVMVRGGPFGGGPSGREPVTPYTRAIAETDRGALRRELGRALRNRDGTRGEVTAAYKEALSILRADPYDAAAMEAILRKQAELTDRRRRQGEAFLAGYLARMSIDERHAYADRLEDEIERFRRKHAGRDGKPD
jgi:uncharacterized membrane protein